VPKSNDKKHALFVTLVISRSFMYIKEVKIWRTIKMSICAPEIYLIIIYMLYKGSCQLLSSLLLVGLWCLMPLSTTLVVIGTDCIGICNSNYHTIMTAPVITLRSSLSSHLFDIALYFLQTICPIGRNVT